MKRAINLLLVLCMVLCLLAGCRSGITNASQPGTPDTEKPVDLVVFAAASLTETLNQIAKDYKEVAPNITLVFNFDSSGTLKTQVEEGADCDLFLSAAPKQMNELEELGLLVADSRIDLLENKVALAVPDGNPAEITSYDDLKERLQAGNVLLVMGNSDVPVGQYTQKIFTYYGLDEAALAEKGCITYGSNVKEVTTQVSEAAADCGIIYATDAASAGLAVVDTATQEMCGQVIYPAAVLNTTQNQDAARAFLSYLTGEAAGAVFASVGFTPLA